MRTVDAAPFYDLPEAGPLLWADPVRLARDAAQGRIPALRTPEGWALPRAWVDAEAGVEPADADALKTYWLTRLAPPSRDARRALRSRARLPAERLLSAAEAAQRLCCDAARLERLNADGTLPALRVDGAPQYDALLVEALVAEEREGPAGGAAAALRRAAVLTWAQAEYTTSDPYAAPPAVSSTAAASTAAAGTAPDAPKAYALPSDLASAPDDAGPVEPPLPARPPSEVARAEGFTTVDEDE